MRRRAAAVAIALAPGLGGAGKAAAQSCPGPRPGWETSDRDRLGIILNRVAVSGRGALLWNRVETSRERLRQYLAIVRQMEPMPFTLLQPAADADCAFLEAVRDDIEAALPGADHGCGEWAAGGGNDPGRSPAEKENWRTPDRLSEEDERALEEAADAAAVPKP